MVVTGGAPPSNKINVKLIIRGYLSANLNESVDIYSKSPSDPMLDLVKAYTNWGMDRRDPYGTGYNPYASIDPIKLQYEWSIDLGGDWSDAIPVVDKNGNIYTVGQSTSGIFTLYKINQTGNIINSYTFSQAYKNISTPTISFDGSIITVTGLIGTSPYGNRMFIFDSDLNLLNSYTVLDYWVAPTPSTISPDGRYFVTWLCSEIVKYDIPNDIFYTLTPPITQTYAGRGVIFDPDGNIYILGRSGGDFRVIKLNTSDIVEWNVLVGDDVSSWGNILYYNGKIYVWLSNWDNTLSGYSPILRVIDIETGLLENTYTTGIISDMWSSPTVDIANKQIILPAHKKLFIFKLDSQQLEGYPYPVTNTTNASISVSANSIGWATFFNEGLIGLTFDGQQVFYYSEVNSGTTAPVITDNGELYFVSSEASKLYKFKQV